MPRKNKQQGQKAAEQARTRLKGKLDELISQKETLRYVPGLVKTLQRCHKKIAVSGKEAVSATFGALRAILDEKEQESLSAIEQLCRSLETRVNDINRRLTEILVTVSEATSTAERALGQSDNSVFLSQYSEISQQLEHCLNKCLLMQAECPGPEVGDEVFWRWQQDSVSVKDSLQQLMPPKCQFDEAFVEVLGGSESDDDDEAEKYDSPSGVEEDEKLQGDMLKEDSRGKTKLGDELSEKEWSRPDLVCEDQQSMESSSGSSFQLLEEESCPTSRIPLQGLALGVQKMSNISSAVNASAQIFSELPPHPHHAVLPRYVRATPRFNRRSILTVTVTEVQSPHDFWVQVCGSQLEWLMEQMRVYYEEIVPEPPGRLQVGELCAACFSQDGCWYRALVFAVHNSDMFSVLYIDYGNSETLPPSRLAKLNSRFTHLPFQAFHCSLAAVKPCGVAVEWNPNNVMQFLQSVADQQLRCVVLAREDCPLVPLHLVDLGAENQGSISSLLVRSMLAVPSLEAGGLYWSEVCKLSRQSSIHPANESRKTHSFVKSDTKTSSPKDCSGSGNAKSSGRAYKDVTLPHKENSKSPTVDSKATERNSGQGSGTDGDAAVGVGSVMANASSTVDGTFDTISRYELEDKSEVMSPVSKETLCDASASGDHRCASSDFEMKSPPNHSRQLSSSSVVEDDFAEGLLPVDDEGYVRLLLSYVISPAEFFAHVVDTTYVDQFNKIREILDKFDQTSCTDTVMFVPRLRQPCCVFSRVDKKWFRSVVVGVTDEQDTVRVQYVDHGETLEVSLKDIRPLPKDLLTFPALAIRCALAGLCPISDKEALAKGGTIYGWSREAVQYLRQFVSDSHVMVAQVIGHRRHSSRSSSTSESSPSKRQPSSMLPWQHTVKVNLYDTSGVRDVFINQLMVDDNLASSPILSQRPKVDGVRLVRLDQKDLEQTADDMEHEGVDTSAFYLTEKDLASPVIQEALASWDPMKSDYENLTNSYGVDFDDPGEALVNYRDRQRRPICRLFQTAQGCHRGSSCRFEHVQPGVVTNDQDTVLCDNRIADLPNPGCWVAVVVSVILETHHCWVQFPYGVSEVSVDGIELKKHRSGKAEDDDLESLVSRMCTWYSQETHFTADQVYWADGELVAVHESSDERWYRCRVLASDGDQVHVFFIDYGNVAWVSRRDLRKLAMEFVHFPAQAVECYLANCFPPSKSDKYRWHPEGRNKLQELTAGKVLLAHVISKGANGTVSLELYDVNEHDETYLHINKELVEQGYASVGKFLSKPWDFSATQAAINPNKPLLLPG